MLSTFEATWSGQNVHVVSQSFYRGFSRVRHLGLKTRVDGHNRERIASRWNVQSSWWKSLKYPPKNDLVLLKNEQTIKQKFHLVSFLIQDGGNVTKVHIILLFLKTDSNRFDGISISVYIIPMIVCLAETTTIP